MFKTNFDEVFDFYFNFTFSFMHVRMYAKLRAFDCGYGKDQADFTALTKTNGL